MSERVIHRSRRRWRSLVLAAAPLWGACYVYSPVMTPEPQPGTRLALDLNDQGRAALVTSVGPEVARVEGALVSNGEGTYVIRVSGVLGLRGTRTKWSGETVSFREEHLSGVREKRLSGGRTAFLVGGLVGAMVGLVASTDLVGFGSNSGDGRGGEPGEQ
jgi:hypothetical protein